MKDQKDRRKGDPDARKSWLRSGSRVFETGGLWYFHTREGSIEGPFTDRFAAQSGLEDYTKIMGSSFAPSSSFTLQEKEDEQPRVAEPTDNGFGRFTR